MLGIWGDTVGLNTGRVIQTLMFLTIMYEYKVTALQTAEKGSRNKLHC